MSLCSNSSNLRLIPARDEALFFLRRRPPIRAAEFRVFHKKRHRLKQPRRLAAVAKSSPPHFDSLAPGILGLTSGLAAYLSAKFLDKWQENRAQKSSGDWVLFTSPSSFNRFVLLRCPSISFDGEGLDERLVQEERHFVRLDSGTIPAAMEDCGNHGGNLEYQRVCVETEDGGVVSLDWPDNLALEEERGLDTTVVLVAGTPKGSMEPRVRSFVCEALRRGLFPVVMNPRGCAGSPLTTPRLFTAADSDDVSTAIQFISKMRSWTTLMAVGWGYGANMLTKYLAEVKERTPLTAAACIDNPFDLEEATTFSPHRIALDRQLAGGLVDILRVNKELFQGRTKGYDVEKGLSSKSVRDFEKAISMVAYGFREIEDFYSQSSTRRMVGNLKIPVLFIQNDEGIVPLFSIPRASIAKNPFTSLLLCSSSPSGPSSGVAALSWCHSLTIEWLIAVELALLKGRHPLLKDVDVTINPSQTLAFLEEKISGKGAKVEKLLGQTQRDALSGYSSDEIRDVQKDHDARASFQTRAKSESLENIEDDNHELQRMENGAIPESQCIEGGLLQGSEFDGEDTERGEILQTAQVVMNMLDVTMPNTLNAEEKKKVLAAVDQGETLVKALQDAVPEDVRDKLTTAVSGILNTHGRRLKFDRVRSGAKNQEQGRGSSSGGGVHKDVLSSNETKSYDVSPADSSDTTFGGTEKPAGEGLELHPPETSHESGVLGQGQMKSSNQDDISNSIKKANEGLGSNHESDEPKEEKPSSDSVEKTSETGISASETNANSETDTNGLERYAKASISSQEKTAETEYVADGENMAGQYNETSPQGRKEDNVQKNEEKQSSSSSDQNKIASKNVEEHVTRKEENVQKYEENTPDSADDQSNAASRKIEENVIASPGSVSESQIAKKEGSDCDNQMKENKNSQPAAAVDQTKSTPPEPNPRTFSVSQALDALAGIDDSTQVAVNSVFGVLEDMISRFEQTQTQENEAKDETKGNDANVIAPEHQRSDGLGYDVQNRHVEGADGSYRNHGVDELDIEQGKDYDSFGGKFVGDSLDSLKNALSFKTAKPYDSSVKHEPFQGHHLPKLPSTKRLDLDSTTALLLDYYPEEGQWKLLEQHGSSSGLVVTSMNNREVSVHSNRRDDYIEPAYVIFDAEQDQKPVEDYDVSFNNKGGDDNKEELVHLVQDIIVESLKVEVSRRLSLSDMKRSKRHLDGDIKKVADAVSNAVGYDAGNILFFKIKKDNVDWNSKKAGTLCGETIIKAISSAVQDTRYLRRVLPVGVIVGSSLAALRKYFHVSSVHDKGQRNLRAVKQPKKSGKKAEAAGLTDKTSYDVCSTESGFRKQFKARQNIENGRVMVGAVTAALGASALLVQQQDPQKGREINANTSNSMGKGTQDKEPDKPDNEKNHNIVSSLAERAMCVAAPVVPTKEDGGIDQERLVAMLADLGQKGGILRLVGKIALLWGGIRGAMSLTDRLIMFLRIAERPLWQRILGFAGMALVLWSPVVVPLLPTLVQSWSTNQPSIIAELACLAGLYTAVLILITLWGQRIRGYENPLREYGLDLISIPTKKIQDYVRGLAGGIVFVLLIQSVNVLIGGASFSCPAYFSSQNAAALLRGYAGMLLLTIRGIITATSVVLVEELLFRSWLPDEIAAELGYNRGIIISGLAFSLSQRSFMAVPGLWLLSLALAGARQRSQGSLMTPVGLRTGIMASSYIFQAGGFFIYNPGFPAWLVGAHPLQPLSGMIGLGFALLLAIILYPTKELETEKEMRKAV